MHDLNKYNPSLFATTSAQIALLLCLLSSTAYGQSTHIRDSLEATIPTINSPIHKVKTYITLGSLYSIYDSAKSVAYLEQADQLAKEIGYIFGEIEVEITRAWNTLEKQEINKAEILFEKALIRAKKANYPNGKASCYSALAKYQELKYKNLFKAKSFLRQSFEASDSTDRGVRFKISALKRIAKILIKEEEYDQADSILNEVLAIAMLRKAHHQIPEIYYAQSESFQKQFRIDSAYDAHLKGLQYSIKIKDSTKIAIHTYQCGRLLFLLGNYDSAYLLLKSSENLLKLYNYPDWLASNYDLQVKYFLNKSQNDSAEIYNNLLIEIPKIKNDPKAYIHYQINYIKILLIYDNYIKSSKIIYEMIEYTKKAGIDSDSKSSFLITLYNQIYLIQSFIGNFYKKLEIIKKIEKLEYYFEEFKNNIYCLKADYFIDISNFDSASFYIEKINKIDKSRLSCNQIAHMYYQVGRLQIHKSDYYKASENFQKASKIYKK